MMNINIHPESVEDFPAIFKLVKAAFARDPLSDHREQMLVGRIRKASSYIPELALVAKREEEIVGYVLLSRIYIEGGKDRIPALSLAPIAVKPEYQQRGMGGQLMNAAHKRARKLGHKRIIILGHADYYPRFGYERCQQYGLKLPFEAPPENCLILGLEPGALEGIEGKVVYPAVFFE